MYTISLLLTTVALATHARFLQKPIFAIPSEQSQSTDNSLLVDAARVAFTAETNLTDQRLKAGDSLSVYCEAVGTPSINVYWTLNGRVVQGHRRRSNLERLRNEGKLMIGQNVVGSRLELECVDERMTGTLSCVADNGIEITKTSVQISTTGSHECSRMRSGRPQIGTWTKSRIEEIGNAVVFQCRKTSGAVSIRWENEDGKELKREDGFMALPNGDMLIPDLKWEHLGTYFCIATNEEGEERVESFVFPTDKDAPSPSGGEEDYEPEEEY